MHGMLHSLKRNLFILTASLMLVLSASGAQKVSENILITENTEQLDLTSMAYFLEDREGVLDVISLQKPEFQGKFQPLTIDKVNVGVTRSVIWLGFKLKYLSFLGENLGLWLLEVGQPSLDLVTLYYEDETGEFQTIHSGDKYPFWLRSVAHPSFLFPVELASGDTRQFYLRIETSGSMQLPLNLWTPLAYVEYTALDKTLSGILLGVILMMLVYIFARFLMVQDYSYFFLSAYMGSFLVYHLTVSGIGMAALWSGFPQMNSTSPFFMCLAGVLIPLFTRSFMSLSENAPRLDWLFILLALFGLLAVPGSLLIHYGIAARLVIWQAALVLPVVMITGLYFWLIKKNRSALLFSLAFFCMAAGWFIYSLVQTGQLAGNLITGNAILLGQAIQAVLLGVALSVRSRQMIEQKSGAEKAKNRELEAVNERLQNSNYLNQDIFQSVSRQLSKPVRRTIKALELYADTHNRDNRTELLHEARQHSKEAGNLIKSLLTREEFQTQFINLVKAPFHLRRQLEILEDRYRPIALQKKLEFSVKTDDSVPLVLLGDFRKLMKALSYLADNAIRFTEQGYINIFATARMADESGKYIINFKVKDSGIGIDARYQEKVYQVFEQINEADDHESLGIGLAACRHLANVMGGSVHHYPLEDSGTCFELEVTLSKYGS